MTPNPSRRRRPSPLVAAPLVLALVAAACGGDDDEPAAEPAAESDTEATEPESETTDAPDTTDATETTETTEVTDTSDAPSGDASGFASMEEIAAMCPADIAPDKLVLSTWASQEELIGPAFDSFTEATGVEIEFLANDLGDRLTKMAAESGSPTIDVAIVPINEAAPLFENGVTEAADETIPNYEQLLDVAKMEAGYGGSIIQFGIAYNPEFVTEAPTSWTDLLSDEFAGHIGFPTMPNSGGYASLAMLNRMEGGTDDDLSAAVELIGENSDKIATFYPNSPAVEPQVAAGEVWIYPDIGGAALASMDRGNPIEFTIPEEGGPVGMNTLVVPAGSDHLPCTLAFISHFIGQEVQEAWAEKLYYGSVSSDFVVPEGLTVYPNDPSTIVEVDWATMSANGPDTIDLWNRVVVG